MITTRIYEWARSQPTKPAVISEGGTLRYADFARAIESARSYFEQQGFPVGHTVIVHAATLVDAWVFVMALRAIGLTTVCVHSVDHAEELKLGNVAAIVLSEHKAKAPKFDRTSLADVKVIMVPSAIFSNIQTGEPPHHPGNSLPFGGHILQTSGTTGSYKKVLLDGSYEDRRNAARMQVYPLNKNMTYHVGNFAPWSSTGFKMPSAVWHTGGCVVMDTSPDALHNFFRHAIDLSILTPFMLRELI